MDPRLQQLVEAGVITADEAAEINDGGQTSIERFLLIDQRAIDFFADHAPAEPARDDDGDRITVFTPSGVQADVAQTVADYTELINRTFASEQNRVVAGMLLQLSESDRTRFQSYLDAADTDPATGEAFLPADVIAEINRDTGVRIVPGEPLNESLDRVLRGMTTGFAPFERGQRRLFPSPKEFKPTEDYRNEHPETFVQFKSFLMSEVGLPERLADSYAQQEGNRTGYTDLGQFLLDKEVLGGAERLMSGSAFLPSNFRDEFGTYYVNTNISGPVPIPWNPVKTKVPEHQLDKIDDPFERAFLAGTGRFTGRGQHQVTAVPTIPRHEVKSFLTNYRPRGGGGGGGIRFDRNAIRERIRDKWRALLLEEPPNVDAKVSAYIAASRAAGVGLNVDAWVTGQIEASPRAKMLYQHKPPGQSMSEYIGGFRSVAAGFGLRDPVEAIVSGAASGASTAGFARRLQGSREVRTNQRGQLSQRFADTFRGLGALRNT